MHAAEVETRGPRQGYEGVISTSRLLLEMGPGYDAKTLLRMSTEVGRGGAEKKLIQGSYDKARMRDERTKERGANM